MCGDSPPPPTNPFATAAAQQQANLATTMQNQAASNVNQITPYGSSTYYQTGIGPNGIPTYTNVQQLTPAQQTLLGLSQRSAGLAGGAGSNLLANTFGQYSTAPDLSNQAGGLTQQLLQQQTGYLKPYFTSQTEQLDTRLRNQGIMPNTPAYNQQMMQLQDTQDRAVTDFLSKAEPMAFDQARQQYQLPLQIATQLAGMGQPVGLGQNYINTPQAGGAPADIVGAVSAADKANQDAYKSQVASTGAKIEGASKIAGAVIGAMMMSDRRLKRDIRRIGTWSNGLPLYRFRYLWSDAWRVGFLADEVSVVRPEAVGTIGGFGAIDYRVAMA